MDEERRNWTIWRTLEIKIDGRLIIGSYSHNKYYKLLEVRTEKASKISWLGGSSPQVVARTLLREMAKEGAA
jgi:hypothetical protein